MLLSSLSVRLVTIDILAGPSTPAVSTEDEDDGDEVVPESKNVKSLQNIKTNTRAQFSGLFKAGKQKHPFFREFQNMS